MGNNGKLRSTLRPKAKPKVSSQKTPPPQVILEEEEDEVVESPRSHTDPGDGALIARASGVPHHKLYDNLPPRALEPKVLLPYEHVRGRVPRKIEMERKRRQYEAQDIERLCQIAGLSLNEIGTREGLTLPLEIFDDTSFDPRTADEWMSLAHDGVPDNAPETHFYLPAKALHKDKTTSQWTFDYCRVVDWNKESNKLRILWGAKPSEIEESSWLPRLLVNFLSEDPTPYTQRLVKASKQRNQALEWLRYEIYFLFNK